jgi:hypothetical protein
MRVKTILRNDGVCVCPSCDREWSAMMGENEMPEFCPDCSTDTYKTYAVTFKCVGQGYNLAQALTDAWEQADSLGGFDADNCEHELIEEE